MPVKEVVGVCFEDGEGVPVIVRDGVLVREPVLEAVPVPVLVVVGVPETLEGLGVPVGNEVLLCVPDIVPDPVCVCVPVAVPVVAGVPV